MTKLIHVNKTNSSGYSNFTVYLKSEGSPINLTLAIFDIIDLFFNESIKTPQSKYFVLLKIMIDEFQFKTLHKGKIITIESKEAYKEFVLEMLSFKGSDYQDLQPAALIFDYFKLPEDWKAVNDEWTEIRPPAPQGDKTSKVKLDKFGKFLKENIHKHWNLRYHYSLNIISIFFILGLTFLFIKDLNLNKSCA